MKYNSNSNDFDKYSGSKARVNQIVEHPYYYIILLTRILILDQDFILVSAVTI